MVDIARLSISVDARQATTAADALNRLTATGGRAETQTRSTSAAYQRTSGTLAGLSQATRQAASANTRAQSAYDTLGNTMRALQGNTAGAALSLINLGTAANAADQKTQAAGRGLGAAATAAGKAGTSIKGAGAHTANLAAQFNDIGVQLAAGQSPLMLAVQQGTQINQVLAQMGGGGVSALKSLSAAFASVISPTSLLTIGLIAGGAALAQWGIRALSAGRETRTMADIIDDAGDSFSAYQSAVDDATSSMEDLEDRFGSGAKAIRPFLEGVRELQLAIVQTDIDKFGQSLTNQFTGTGILSVFQTLEGSLNKAFNLESLREFKQIFDDFGTGGTAFEVLPENIRKMRVEFFGLLDAFEEAKGNLQEQDKILGDMFTTVTKLADADGKRAENENQILQHISQARLITAETLADKEKTEEVDKKADKAAERRADWAARTLSSLEAQTAESQAIFEYGADSTGLMAQQVLSAREALDTDLQRRGITGEVADNIKTALVAQQEAGVAAKERIRYDREAERISQELARLAKQDLQTTIQRQHAEASIAQRLANRIEMARAIVVHGKDSVQAKLAEEAVSRRLFELDLERQGITGDIRDQLIAQYEAAATLEGQIIAAQPAFQGLNTIIDGISNAWAEWVVRGFDDFKSFTKSVLDSFKRLLVQMIATAAKNRIMLSLGIGGGLGGIAGAADGGLGGLLGGGGGGIGKIFSSLKGLLGGGDGGGLSGMFKSIKNFFGFGGGGGIAGGGAAVAAGGAVAGGAGGFGAFGLAGAGAAGGAGLGGAAALAGPVGLGIGAVIAMGGPLIFAAFKTKTKILDEGITLAVDGMDTLVESFKRVEKSRFFGLSKKRRTTTGAVDEEISNPIIEVVDSMRTSLLEAAGVLGFGSERISAFSTDIKLSFKGLSDAEREAKLAEALTNIGDGMAKAAIGSGKLSENIDATAAGLIGLAQTFVGVNAVLELLGKQPFGQGRGGAGRTVDLASQFGGVDQFANAAQNFYQQFIPEAEQIQDLRDQIEALGVTVPATAAEFRALVDAQDLYSASGRELFATLLQLAPAVSTIQEYEARLADEREQAAEAALQLVEAERQRTEAAKAARSAFEGSTLTMVQGLTDSPEQAFARQRDELLAEAESLGADTENVVRWYELQIQAIRDQAAAKQEAEQAAIEAQKQQAEARAAQAAQAARAAGAEQARQLFTPQADLMAGLRDELTGAGSPLVGSEYLAELKRLRDVDVERYDALLAYAPQLRQLIDYEQELADEREAGVKRVLEATRQAIIDEISVSVQSAQEAAGSVRNLQFNVQRRPSPSGTLQEAVNLRGSTTGPDRELLELDIFHRATSSAIQRSRNAQAASLAAAGRAVDERIRAEGHLEAAMGATTDEARRASTALARRAQHAASEASSAAVAYAAIARSEQNLAVFADSIRHLSLNLDIANRSARGAANSIINLLGGTDDFQARVASYYQNFFSQGERFTNAQDDLSISFQQLSLAVPQTRREFRALVEAQDLTTKSGQETFASLIDLSDQFAFVTSEANKLNDVLGGSQRHFRNLREEAFVRSASPTFGGDDVARQTATSDPLFLELIRAINQGNVRVERELEDLRRETRRTNREPTRQTVT